MQNLKFHNSLYNFIQLCTTLVETLPIGVGMNFGEQICCALSEEVSLEFFFSPIWSHVNENEKNWQKSKI